MEIDQDRQVQALTKAKAMLADAEKKREAARVEKSVQIFLQGTFEVLNNDEFVENLASYVLNKHILDERQEAIKVLEKLGKSLCSNNVHVRERSLMVLSVFTEIILEEDFEEFYEVLSRILVDWLKFENEYIAGFEFVCSQLQKIIVRMLYSGQWYEPENLIIILYKISTGATKKSNLIRGMSAKVYENLAEPDIIDKLVNVYLDEGDDRRAVAESLLIHFGRYSAMFLVQKLIYSNNKEERFALIGLIPRVGEVSVPVLSQCLKDEPPWFVIRNIVLIISRLGNNELFSIVEPYLTHKDIRVQQQVINCIEVLGGKEVRKRMANAMMLVNDELKGQLIIQLGQFDDMDVGNAFLDLLEKRHTIARHVQDDLILKLCLKTKFYPVSRAVVCLKDLIRERRERYGNADKVVLAAATTSLQAIEMRLEENGIEEDHIVTEAIPEIEVEEAPEEEDIFAQSEVGEAESLFSDDEIEGISVGDDTVVTSAQSEAGQEDQVGGGMPFYASQDHHLLVWSKLYEQMSTDEVNDFFTLLKPVAFNANEEIVNRGDNVTDLYFIDSGFAGISHVVEDGEILLTSLQTGELIGTEGFIRGLTWSIALRAQTDLQVRILNQSAFENIADKHPELSEKLHYYCDHYDVIPYLINLSEDTAEKPIGKDFSVDTNELIMDASGTLVEGNCTGTLMYVARGGYCFTLPYIHENNAETILGRQVSAEIVLKDGSKKKCFGVIAGAGTHKQDDQVLFGYVKFYHPLEKADYHCKNLEIM